MQNPRITAKDRSLIKGSLRRAFARSELRRSVLQDAKVVHSDPKRPRVKTWYKCAVCGQPYAQHQLAVDHLIPVVPVDSSLEEMTWDDLVNRMWCVKKDLQVLCDTCHTVKTNEEKKLRKEYKNGTRKKR